MEANNNTKGIFFIMTGMAFFSIQDSLIKFIFEDISNIADSKENFANKINEIIERSVTKAPEHYLWHHRRFKSQAPEIYD